MNTNTNLILSFNYTNDIKINVFQGSFGKYYNIEDNTEENKLYPFFDTAYQGFVSGDLDKDGIGLRYFLS